MNDSVIKVENLSKQYRLGLVGGYFKPRYEEYDPKIESDIKEFFDFE